MVDRCRICGQPATHEAGSYAFCDAHFERLLRQRRSLWRADALALLGVLAFVSIVWVLDALLSPRIDGAWLVGVGLVVSIVPAALWMILFYQWDRLEPEPKGLVIQVMLLAALLEAAIGIPAVRDFFDVGAWLDRGLAVQIAGNILVIGLVQVALIYLTVRLFVYSSPDFNEWTDGILYGTAAGLGVALVLNVDFIAGSGGADLGTGALRVALTALVLSSIGGLVGYFLGHDRLEVRPVWFVPAGAALAAILAGIYWWLRTSVTGGFVGPIPKTWIGLGLAVVLAAVVTVFLASRVRGELDRAVRRLAVPGGTQP